jgi:hypothetical protein
MSSTKSRFHARIVFLDGTVREFDFDTSTSIRGIDGEMLSFSQSNARILVNPAAVQTIDWTDND